MTTLKKRKTNDSTLPKPKGFEDLKGLDCGFKNNDLMKKHTEYYKYNDSKKKDVQEYLLGKDKNDLFPFLPALSEIQKSRMNPDLFETFEGKHYQWKYEKVLKGPYIWKSSGNLRGDSDIDSDNDSDSDKKMKIPDDTDYVRARKFTMNTLDLQQNRISLELKKGNNFAPWIYFKTVEVQGKKTVGVFANRDFPVNVTIGFYISHPWFKWVEPFTVEPPNEYDAYLQQKHLLPEEEANSYLWFYDDEGYMTACDPVRRPPKEKGEKEDNVPRKRIIGMGFHLVNETESVNGANMVVDCDGCVKTKKEILAGTQIIM
jgi:hypothetical protein